jgi:hypothetical protein
MESHLDIDCPETLLKCPNSCGESIKRKNIEEHLKECPLQIIQCDVCGDEFARNKEGEHNCLQSLRKMMV